jgi:hypothetical protein
LKKSRFDRTQKSHFENYTTLDQKLLAFDLDYVVLVVVLVFVRLVSGCFTLFQPSGLPPHSCKKPNKKGLKT